MSPRSPMLRALGADHVIDYRKEDYSRSGERYDFILDVVRFLGLVFKRMSDPEKRKNFKIPKKAEALETFRELLAAGKLTPVIGRTFALGEVVAAMKCMQAGTVGRMIIKP